MSRIVLGRSLMNFTQMVPHLSEVGKNYPWSIIGRNGKFGPSSFSEVTFMALGRKIQKLHIQSLHFSVLHKLPLNLLNLFYLNPKTNRAQNPLGPITDPVHNSYKTRNQTNPGQILLTRSIKPTIIYYPVEFTRQSKNPQNSQGRTLKYPFHNYPMIVQLLPN